MIKTTTTTLTRDEGRAMSAEQRSSRAAAIAKAGGFGKAETCNALSLAAMFETKAQLDAARAAGREVWTVINLGMGVDSTAILCRLAADGLDAHGIERERAVVITAQTGDELPDLLALVDAHTAPLIKSLGLRWVQVAQSSAKPGSKTVFTLLGDTDVDGDYRAHGAGDLNVLDEYERGGTAIQSGNARLCSIKAKGYPIDAWLAANIPAGAVYRQLIGFESNELGRVFGDVFEGADGRLPEYPLIDWAWDRAACLGAIKSTFGVDWLKSCCAGCPFAGQGAEKDLLAARWRAYPERAARVMVAEHSAQALNEHQTWFGGRRPGQAWDRGSTLAFAAAQDCSAAVEAYEARLASMTWAVYRVRRIWSANARRSVEIVARGTKAEVEARLAELAAEAGVEVERHTTGHRISRAVVAAKPADRQGAEELLAVAPMLAEPKVRGCAERFEAAFVAAGGRPSSRVEMAKAA